MHFVRLVCLLGAVISLRAEENPKPEVPLEDKRMFGIIPNYKTVPLNGDATPIRARDKFRIAARDSFDPMTFVVAGINATQTHLSNQYPTLGQGTKGFAQRYVRAEADIISSNFITEGALPSLLHLDPRYFRKGEGTAKSRTGYALSRIWLIRGDDRKDHFNIPELGGNLAVVFLGTLYYPGENRNGTQLMTRYAFQVGTDAAFNVVKEFLPEIKSLITRRKRTSTLKSAD